MSGRNDDLVLEPVGLPEGWDGEHVFTIQGEEPFLIGRGQQARIRLPDISVSRRQATIVRQGKNWMITDLGSKHGTFVNGVKMQPEQPEIVRPGDFIRVGTITLRVQSTLEAGMRSGTRSTTISGDEPGTIVQRVSNQELDSLAVRRLKYLIDGAAVLHQSKDETELAAAAAEVALAGSGHQRAAVLRHRTEGEGAEVEVLASRDARTGRATEFSVSRSLLREAAGGHIARLSTTSGSGKYGESIVGLNIHSALCAPIFLGDAVVALLYLDSRESEQAGYEDAASYCHAVARLAGLALANVKRSELEERQARLDADLRAARQAQEFLCPKTEGEAGAVGFALEMHPGRMVAGDLFDIFSLDAHRVAICFGDVSGQGVGAALLMAAVLSHLRASLSRDGNTQSAVRDVNKYIAERSSPGSFMTLWVGIYDAAENRLSYIDCGHGHWAIKRNNENAAPIVGGGGIPIGIEPTFQYTAESITLSAGDRIILYSDGIVEHRNPENEQFGAERILEIVSQCDSPASDVHSVMGALRAYIQSETLSDDTTIASIVVRDGS